MMHYFITLKTNGDRIKRILGFESASKNKLKTVDRSRFE